jgi:hypothetical protein
MKKFFALILLAIIFSNVVSVDAAGVAHKHHHKHSHHHKK